jgi:MFS family permease
VLFLAALSYFFSAPGQTYFTSTFIETYIQEFGWSRSTISSLYSMATLVSGVLLFLMGRQIDRHGQKKMSITVAGLLGLTCIWMSFVSSMPMLFIGFFASRFLGQGSMTLIPSTLVPNWFARRRPLAFSLMSIGGVVGSSILPPVNSMLIAQIGWRPVWRFWAAAFWIIYIPLVLAFLYNQPAELGLSITGEDKKASGASGSVVKFKDVPSWTLKEAFRTRSFWGMLYSQLLLPMVVTGLTFHFISIMAQRSIQASQAAYVLSLLALVSFPTTLFAGWILGKIKIHHAALLVSVLMGSALAVLLLSDSYPGAIVFTVLIGSAMGLQTVWGGLVWPQYFGTRYLGSIRSLAMTMTVIGSAVGPIPLGFIYDRTGNYQTALLSMVVLCVLGVISASMSPQPHKAQVFKNDSQFID